MVVFWESKLKCLKNLCILGITVLSTLAFASGDLDFLIETGGVWQKRNDIQIPQSTGTRIAIDEFDEGPFFYYRLEAFFRITDKQALRLVYAPLSIEVKGPAAQLTTFDGQTYSSAEDLTVRYQFNSYRLSYFYGFWDFGDDQINLGITGKVRDAKTTVSQKSASKSYDNVGFVPLAFFEYQKMLSAKWHINFSLDAAVAEQGRAIDAALKARYRIAPTSSLGIGFRTLEGGADNKKIFTFSWFNYALFELKVTI